MNNHLMKGIIDMHVHSNPDLRHRAYDDFELMEAGIRVGARAIVIKTHQGTTMDRAYLCNRHNEIVHKGTNEFTMFGSITLNQVVGGLKDVYKRQTQTLMQAFANSCNGAFASLGLELNSGKMRDLAEQFLYNQSLPLAIPYNKSCLLYTSRCV